MWSAHKAAVHARQHAGQYSQKRCAEFVSKSIRAGGANLQNTHYAKDMKSNLILAGFHQVYGEPVEGDVAVIQPTANGVWYSDFVQRTMYPGKEYREVKPAYAIYRHD